MFFFYQVDQVEFTRFLLD